jgi:ATP-dependent helicase/DNAse subunit B
MPLFSQDNAALSFTSLRSEFERRTLAGEGDSVLYIVPNRVARNTAEREILDAAGQQALTKINVLTLDEFVGELFGSAFPDIRRLSDSESAVLIEESVRELQLSQGLSYFESPRTEDHSSHRDPFPLSRGTFELVVNTLRRLAETGVTLDSLRNDITKLERTSVDSTELRRARDIARIYQGYLRRQGERFTDRSSMVVRLLERYAKEMIVLQDLARVRPDLRMVLIDGFDVLERPQVQLFDVFAKQSEVRFVIRTRSGSNPDLFAAVRKLEEEIESVGYVRLGESEKKDASEFAEFAATVLFCNEAMEQREFPNVTIKECADPAAEVQSIARSIKYLFSEAKIPPDLSRIVVATPNPEEYTPLFREIFAQYGIPVFIADRYHLDRSPLMQGVMAMMDVARFGPRTGALSRLLSNPFFRIKRVDGTPIDRVNLRAVLSRHRLTGEFGKVQRRLRGIISSLDFQLQGEEVEASVSRDRDECIHALEDLNRLHQVLASLSEALTPREFRAALNDLLDACGVRYNLLAHNRETLSAGTLEVDTRAYRAFQSLVEELESLFLFLGLGDERLPLAFYQERLRAAAIVTRYNPRPNPKAVQVLSLQQSIDHPADHLFLAGLNDDQLPQRYQPQVFLLDSLQYGEAKQLAEERLSYFRAITNFRTGLVLSYARRSSTGRTRVASRFLTELSVAMAPVKEQPQKPAVYSYAELYREYARRAPNQRVNLVRGARKFSPFGFYRPAIEERVPRALQVDELRRSTEPSQFAGQLDSSSLREEEAATLAANATGVWSVSQLELYGSCGFKYFLRSVLRLEGVDGEEEGLEATDKGVLLHEVLHQFMERHRDDKLHELPLEEVIEEIHTIARDELATYDIDHPFWKLDAETIAQDTSRNHSILRRFVEQEHKLSEGDMRPRFFEFPFGPSRRIDPDAAILDDEAVIEGIRLRGKIDRIDVDPEDRYFTIIDYKSGNSVSKIGQMKRGTSLQLPIYLRVAQDVLRSHRIGLGDAEGVGGIYQKLSDPTSRREVGLALSDYHYLYPEVHGKLLKSKEELQELIAVVIAHAKRYVEGIANGSFLLTEYDLTGNCKRCEYSHACRVQEAIGNGVLRDPVQYETESSNAEGVQV